MSVVKNFLPSAFLSIFSGSHGFCCSAQAWALWFSALQTPGLLCQACRSRTCVQSNLWITLSFFSFFFQLNVFTEWHERSHYGCVSDTIFDVLVLGTVARVFHQVKKQLVCWCLWLPGARVSVSGDARTFGCLVLKHPCLWPCHVWLPGAQASMSRDVRTWSFVVCLCLWCQWGATREVVLSVAVKLLFLLPWIIQRSITDVCQPQKLAQ